MGMHGSGDQQVATMNNQTVIYAEVFLNSPISLTGLRVVVAVGWEPI